MDGIKKNNRLKNSQNELALPDELPKKPDLSYLPEHVLRSNALETLLQQNNELMSRLSVNLRRISHLENKIESQNKIIAKFEHNYSIIKDEVFILKEQSNHSVEKLDKKKAEYNKVYEKYKAIQFEYEKLFQESGEQKKHLMATVKTLETRLKSLLKFKRKVLPISKKFRAENRKYLMNQSFIEEQSFTLKQKITELANILRRQKEEFQEETRRLSRDYSANMDSIKAENDKLLEKARNADLTNEKLIQVKNELIFTERKLQESTAKMQVDVNTLKEENTSYRREMKKLKVENIELQKRSDHFRKQLHFNESGQREVADQLENTQLLFSNLQGLLEKEKAKTASLQRINKQMSSEMNAYRSTIQKLKEGRDQTLTSPTPQTTTQVASPPAGKEQNKVFNDNAIERISNLIFEIEKDFR